LQAAHTIGDSALQAEHTAGGASASASSTCALPDFPTAATGAVVLLLVGLTGELMRAADTVRGVDDYDSDCEWLQLCPAE
jgi:hypothetical protein